MDWVPEALIQIRLTLTLPTECITRNRLYSINSVAVTPLSSVAYVPNTSTPDGNEFNNDFYPKVGLDPVDWDMKEIGPSRVIL